MSLSNVLKWLLIFFLLFSCGFDIYSTISDSNFLVLESNFIFHFLGGISILLIFKVIFCVGLSFILYRSDKYMKHRFVQYFYIHMMILLILLQLLAGMNNIWIKNNSVDMINSNTGSEYTDFSQIPPDVVKEQLSVPKKEATMFYIKFMLQAFYVPFFLGLLSFWLWCKIFFDERERIDNDDWKIILEDNGK